MRANYIKQIEIDSLWKGRKHICWQLNPQVNILSGVNGMGKTTILNKLAEHLSLMQKTRSEELARHSNADAPEAIEQSLSELYAALPTGVKITTEPEGAAEIRFDVIRSFDNTMIPASIAAKFTDGLIRSELDWHIYELQRKYLDYQVNIGNQMIKILSQGGADAQARAVEVSQAKTNFQDTIDNLFCTTLKTIDRTSNELLFCQYGETLSPYSLSSGEKQMLIILLTVLLQNNEPSILLMDEPEVSLHVDWQQRLVGIIRDLNPNVQIILTTHSPAMIMDGWLDSVTEVSEIELQ